MDCCVPFHVKVLLSVYVSYLIASFVSAAYATFGVTNKITQHSIHIIMIINTANAPYGHYYKSKK